MQKTLLRVASSVPLMFILSGNTFAPTRIFEKVKADEPMRKDSLHGSFSNIYVPAGLEKQVELWKTIYTKTDDAVIFNTDTYEILDIVSALSKKEAQAKKNNLEAKLIREGKISKGDLGAVRGQESSFRQGYRKILPWLNHMKREFASVGVHPQMANQAILESCFNPDAISSALAVGAYQFLRPTAMSFLMINNAVDERLDPVREGRAAGLLLRANFSRYGDERLAVSGYHTGKGNVDNGYTFSSLVLGDASMDDIFETIVKVFPRQERAIRGSYRFASSSYVSGLLGVIKGIEENFTGPSPSDEVEFDTISIKYLGKNQLSIDELARKTGFNKGDIKKLNPALLYLRTEKHLRRIIPKKVSQILPDGYALRVPKGMGSAVLATFNDRLASTLVEETRAGAPIEVANMVTRGDLLYNSIIEQRMRGMHSRIELGQLQEILKVYEEDLHVTQDSRIKSWIESAIKIVSYDALELKRELDSNYWDKLALYRQRISTVRTNPQ